MNERMRFNPAEAAAAGVADARALLISLEAGDIPTGQFNDVISEMIGLTSENRIEECTSRLEAFCSVIAPALHQACQAPLRELKAAHQIIRNALAVMTTEQKVEWGRLNARDGVDGEGITRANEREAALAKV